MCELEPAVILDRVKCQVQPEPQTPMQELDTALKACKFGKFHLRLLLSTFARSMACLLVTGTTPYLLTSAECDLKMDLVDKGLLNSMPFSGMVFTTVFAGFLTDTFGRRIFILLGLGGTFVAMTMGGFSQTYAMLVTAKFLEGALYGVAHTAAVTLTSEFCHKGIRDRIMICQASFASLSQVAVAAMSWGVLVQDWRYSFFNETIVLNTWNIYLIVMAQWVLISCCLYSFMPESPKFLLTRRRYSEAREVLINIYKENTGKPADTYKYVNLWKDQPKLGETPSETEHQIATHLMHQLTAGLHNVKPLFKKPLILYLMLLGSFNLMILAISNVLRLWFPQLSTIVEHYAENSEDLCAMLDSYTNDLKSRLSNATSPELCVPIKSGTETYVNSMIIGCVTLIPCCVNGILVNKVGKKMLFMTAGIIGVGTILALRWAGTKTAVVSLFSFDVAITHTMISLNIASAVEFFPTAIRTFAVSIVMMMGRFGTLIGNVSFPILLNIGCVVPFFTMTGLMISVVLMSCLLPSKKPT